MFVHYVPLSCTSSPYNLLFLNPGIYGPVQATAGVGPILIWDTCVAFTQRGGGGRVLKTDPSLGIVFGNRMGQTDQPLHE